MTECPICGATPCGSFETSGTMLGVKCRVCGKFEISGTAIALLPPKGEGSRRPYLSAYIRQANVRRETPKILSDNWELLAAAHERTPVSIKLSKVLAYVADKSRYPGDRIEVLSQDDYPLFDAHSSAEVAFLLEALKDRGDLEAILNDRWRLTADGWESLSPMASGGAPGTCFVAMAFDESLDAAYNNGIRPAIEDDCALRVVRIDKIEHNGVVTDLMLAEIRGAQTLVADVTLQRNGVYFEAGFALGLGRTVVWSCRHSDLKNVHFDTRQYSHVVWSTPEDLRQKLATRLRATVQIPAKSSSI